MRAALLAAGLMVAGCVSVTPIHPQVQRIDAPGLGALHTEELGETLVAKGSIQTYEALVLREALAIKGLGNTVHFAPQALLARSQDARYVYFGAADARIVDVLLGETVYPPFAVGIARALADPNDIRWFAKTGMAAGRVALPDHAFQRVEVVQPNSFRQELIYNGRAGSTVKFLYREAAGGTLRGDFTQDVQYDLAEGSVVGFKGARIEVVDATNASITYRVLNTFPD